MKIAKVKREDKEVKVPERKTEESLGYDFSRNEDLKIPEKEWKLVPTGIIRLFFFRFLFLGRVPFPPPHTVFWYNCGRGTSHYLTSFTTWKSVIHEINSESKLFQGLYANGRL